MTEIIQLYPWWSIILVAILAAWGGAAGGLLTSCLCHSAKKGGNQ